LRRRVLNAAQLPVGELSRLNFELGEVFAKAALAIKGRGQVKVIGSHGQTVWHAPSADPPNTLQLAEPSVIAERTGIAVAADFRVRDMAAGGQGAPLVPAFDLFMFGRGPLIGLQNIGGIGNVSVVGRRRLWAGFDTGPGNALMDEAMTQATSGRLTMDRDGRLARRGKPDERLLRRWLESAYFKQRPPKSLDRSAFAGAFLRRYFGRITQRRLPDILATLNLFTARSIALSYRRFIFPRYALKKVLVSGGGALNPVLMGNLSRVLAPLPVSTTEHRGMPIMAKEAACFAWMGWQALRRKANNCPEATGARGPRALGKLVFP
jgi:anhydro-N-acetylmuramic acid kinase